MGIGSILKKVVGVAAPILGSAVGGPIGGAIGNMVGGAISGSGGSANYTGTAADPSTYINIALPGVKYPTGQQSVSLPQYPTMSPYPTLPSYSTAPKLPQNMPLMEASLMNATTGETAMLNALYGAQGAQTASLDPTNPLFKDLASAEESLLNNDYLRNLKQLVTTNRRSGRMGRGQILDPERRDESIASTVLSNAQTNSLQSRIMAQQKLKDYATSMLSTASQYGTASGLENTRRTAYRDDLLQRLNQMRSDITNRTNVARSDFGADREDTMNAFNYNQGLTKEKYKAERDDIIKALEMYKGISSTAQEGAAFKNQATVAKDESLTRGIGDFIGAFINGMGSGGGSSNGYTTSGNPVGQAVPLYNYNNTPGAPLPWL